MTIDRHSPGGIALQVAQTAGTIVASVYGGPWAGLAANALHTAFWVWQDSKQQKVDDVVNRQERLADLAIQTSTLGVPIPQIWGKVGLIAGNVIWATDKIPHEHRDVTEPEGGGKGGPTGPTTVNVSITYTQSYALGLCDTRISGPIAGIAAIYKNSNLYWSREASGDTLPEGWTFYDGSPTQPPDPTMEAQEGAGNVPRYPYLCFVVVADDDQGASGQTAVYTFELFQTTAGTVLLSSLAVSPLTGDVWVSLAGLTQVARYSAATRERLATVQVAPTAPVGSQIAAPLAIDAAGLVWAGDLGSGFIAIIDGATNALLTSFSLGGGYPYSNFVFTGGYAWIVAAYPLDVTVVDGVALATLFLVRMTSGGVFATTDLSIGAGATERLAVGVDGHIWLAQQVEVVGVGVIQARVLRIDPATSAVIADVAGITGATDVAIGADGHVWVTNPQSAALYRINPATNLIQATLAVTTEADTVARASDGYLWVASKSSRQMNRINPADNSVQTFVANAQYRHTQFTRHFAQAPAGAMWVLDDLANTATLVQPDGETASYRTGMQPIDIAQGASDSIWVTSQTGGNLQHIEAGGTTRGLKTGNDLPSLVSALCGAVGLTAVDTTDMPQDLVSMVLVNIAAVREVIEQLGQAYRFYAVESGPVLKFRERGAGPLVFAMTDDDLGAGDEEADESGLTVSRVEDARLPSEVDVSYVDPGQRYQRSTQPGKLTLPSTGVQTPRSVSLGTVILQADSARQLATELAVEAWVGREVLQGRVNRSFAHLEPGDRGTITARGLTYTVVLTETTYGAPGLFEFKATIDASYIRNALVPPPGTPPPLAQTPPVVADTVAHLLNLPALTQSDQAPRYHAAYVGEGEPWPGAALYRSLDGEASFQVVDSAVLEAITGSVAGVVAAHDWHTLDTTTVLTVTLEHGTLTSVSDLALYNGMNRAAVGHASWGYEVIGFGVATLVGENTYELTRLLWGRRGTEWAASQHVSGETLYLLDAGVRRVDMTLEARGVERPYKAVTSGQALADVASFPFTPTAMNLIPWSVAQPSAELSGTDWVFTWRMRSRFNASGVFGPIGFDPDYTGFRLDVFSDNTYTSVVRSTFTDGGNPMDPEVEKTLTYTSAEQTADFGIPQATVYWRVHQVALSGVSVADNLVAA